MVHALAWRSTWQRRRTHRTSALRSGERVRQSPLSARISHPAAISACTPPQMSMSKCAVQGGEGHVQRFGQRLLGSPLCAYSRAPHPSQHKSDQASG